MNHTRIVIIGSGTAGLITALYLNKIDNCSVKVIESSQIGIIGVGEGATEHWKNDLMNDLMITDSELIRETGATFKFGIKFENWNGDNENYFQSIWGHLGQKTPEGLPFNILYRIIKSEIPEHIVQESIRKSIHYKPFDDISQFHFDTYKLNDFLKDKCKEKQIQFIDDIIEDVKIDEDGYIELLIGRERSHSGDFFVDCSGFKRVLSNKYNIGWNSYSKYLSMNRAFAFPTEAEKTFNSYTISRSLKNGWYWKIPTQERVGNGYVYSDKYCDFEDAKQEIEEMLGRGIDVAKSFEFDAGHLEKTWHKNFVSIGLSGFFIEPLEASSIGTTIKQALSLSNLIVLWDRNNTYIEDKYNSKMTELYENILLFVKLHYITKRNDTEFWQNEQDMPVPDKLNQIIDIMRENFTNEHMFDYHHGLLFGDFNFAMVMAGLGLFDKQKLLDVYNLQTQTIQRNAVLNYQQQEKEFVEREGFSNIESIESLNRASHI